MSRRSTGELILKSWLDEWKISYNREVKFSQQHRYRFDFVLLNNYTNMPCLAIEVDGSKFKEGGKGHISFWQYMKDRYRDNVAVYYGWSAIVRIPSLWLYKSHPSQWPKNTAFSRDQLKNIFLHFTTQPSDNKINYKLIVNKRYEFSQLSPIPRNRNRFR